MSVLNYIYWNGKRYYYGTKFKCHNFMSNNKYEESFEIYFWDQNTKSNTTRFGYKDMVGNFYNYSVDTNKVINSIIDVLEIAKNPAAVPKNQREKGFYYWQEDGEWNRNYISDEVYNGTILYIIIMILATIFNGKFIIWAVASLIYWPWRSNKLKGRD